MSIFFAILIERLTNLSNISHPGIFQVEHKYIIKLKSVKNDNSKPTTDIPTGARIFCVDIMRHKAVTCKHVKQRSYTRAGVKVGTQISGVSYTKPKQSL